MTSAKIDKKNQCMRKPDEDCGIVRKLFNFGIRAGASGATILGDTTTALGAGVDLIGEIADAHADALRVAGKSINKFACELLQVTEPHCCTIKDCHGKPVGKIDPGCQCYKPDHHHHHHHNCKCKKCRLFTSSSSHSHSDSHSDSDSHSSKKSSSSKKSPKKSSVSSLSLSSLSSLSNSDLSPVKILSL